MGGSGGTRSCSRAVVSGGGAGLCRIVRRRLRRGVVEGANDGARLLRQPVRRGHQMRGQRNGRHTGVGDADIGEAIDAEVGIDHTALFQGQHGARRRRMILGEDLGPEPFFPFLVGLDVGAGPRLLCECAC